MNRLFPGEESGPTSAFSRVLPASKRIWVCQESTGCFQERSQGGARAHVPYRNSMMTTILRDSLGGNTRTVMIATVNAAAPQLEESLSTCRFAQRVALVTNKVPGSVPLIRFRMLPW